MRNVSTYSPEESCQLRGVTTILQSLFKMFKLLPISSQSSSFTLIALLSSNAAVFHISVYTFPSQLDYCSQRHPPRPRPRLRVKVADSVSVVLSTVDVASCTTLTSCSRPLPRLWPRPRADGSIVGVASTTLTLGFGLFSFWTRDVPAGDQTEISRMVSHKYHCRWRGRPGDGQGVGNSRGT